MLMRPEEQLLLQLLRDHIHGRKTEIPAEGCDWDYFLRLVSSQHLGGIAYVQLRDSLREGETLQGLHGGFLRNVFCHICFRDEFDDVARALSQAGIPFLPMKGIHLCRYYPVSQLRSMSDIDLVIRPGDRQRCHQVMEQLGFACSKDLQEVWTYRRDMASFEIHDWMMYQNLAGDFDFRGYFSEVWDHVVPGEPMEIEPNFHFLFLIVHLAKHVLNMGCGFRNYLDLVMMTRAETLDYPLIEEELRKMGLWKFAGTCFALCREWFGVEMPLEAPALDADFLRIITEKTLRDGAFGIQNQENDNGGNVKAIKREGGPYWRAAVRLVLRGLFPSYENMRLIPSYSFVDGRPWLLPAAWIYRFWYCARNKFGRSLDRLLAPVTQREKILTRKDLMDRWGL